MENETESKEMSNYEKARNFIFGINRIPEFPVDALTNLFLTGDNREIVILPANVKMAWFRAVHPAGHCVDEPFGDCNDTVANVKVTVYATGDCSQELSHAYAVKVFDPEHDGNWSQPERRTKLYNLACGMARSKALTDAGIGMGYYTSRQEFDEISFDSIVRSNFGDVVEPIPQITEGTVSPEPAARAKTTRASAAATAETKLNEFVSVIEQISEMYEGMKANLDDGTRKHFEGSLSALLDRYNKLLADLKTRAEKGAANPDNGISRVLTAEIIAAEVAKLPMELRKERTTDETEAKDATVVESLSSSIPIPETSAEIAASGEAVSDVHQCAEMETSMAESVGAKETVADLSDYVISCLNMALKDIDKKRILWIALSSKPEFSTDDKKAAKDYYRQVADADEIAAFERRLAG